MKNIIKFILFDVTTTILLFQAQTTSACSCFIGDDFVENSRLYENIIRAKVIEYGEQLEKAPYESYDSMVVELTNIIRGNFNHSQLKLIGSDYSFDCLDVIDYQRFKIGQEFLFLINSDEEVQELYDCGEYSVLIENNIVKSYRFSEEGYEVYSTNLEKMLEKMEVKYEEIIRDI